MALSLSANPFLTVPTTKPNQNPYDANFPTNTTKPTISTQFLNNFDTPFELKQLHAHFIKTNTSLSLLPLSRVAPTLALSPDFSYARRIFQQSEKPEIHVWNSCLKAFAESNSPSNAIQLFVHLLEHNVLPDVFTCSFVLKACTSLSDVSFSKMVHGFVEKMGFKSNDFLQNMFLHLYASCGDFGDASRMFGTMSQKDVVSWNTMITQLVKRGDIQGAYDLFCKMPEKNTRSWASMISGFVQCRRPKEAIRVFLEMEEVGVRPNEVTVVAVLAACADLGALELGSRVHECSNQSGYGRNVRISNTLIDMYIKCGCLDVAYKVFNDMEERTVVSWSAMLMGLAMHGQAKEALALFDVMKRADVEPNEVTFVGLLHACSHIGMVNEGRRLFESLSRDYKIVPRIEHYGCMVDLLSRAGHLQEAHDFIKDMPLKPNGVVWGALLGGCKVHKNIEMAEEAISHLHKLDPLNDGYYVVLSNIYAEAGRWDDVARVRKLMRDQGVKKTTGWSSISINGQVHELAAGDQSHPQIEMISQKWRELLEEMKLNGYVPNTSVVLLDIDESEKENILYHHSEKLALAFGLLNTSHGTTIRIMKNLRVCEDCHAAFKVISGIVNREIVVRDRNRFHCFKDGCCSCKDYW